LINYAGGRNIRDKGSQLSDSGGKANRVFFAKIEFNRESRVEATENEQWSLCAVSRSHCFF